MKKIYSVLGLCLILSIGIVFAGATGIAKSSEIDKANRDAVLDKSGAGSINPTFEIVDYTDYILCSGYQEGIINSRDNRIDKCSNRNMTTMICIDYYTSTEMDDKCAELITNKIDNWGSALIERSNPTDTRSGDIEIGEKK